MPTPLESITSGLLVLPSNNTKYVLPDLRSLYFFPPTTRSV
jgi:hypothetical protein